MKNLKRFDMMFESEYNIGTPVKGGMGTSFAEGVVKRVSYSETNTLSPDNKKMYMYKYHIKVTKHHEFSNQKPDLTVVEILATNREDADAQFKKRLGQ